MNRTLGFKEANMTSSSQEMLALYGDDTLHDVMMRFANRRIESIMRRFKDTAETDVLEELGEQTRFAYPLCKDADGVRHKKGEVYGPVNLSKDLVRSYMANTQEWYDSAVLLQSARLVRLLGNAAVDPESVNPAVMLYTEDFEHGEKSDKKTSTLWRDVESQLSDDIGQFSAVTYIDKTLDDAQVFDLESYRIARIEDDAIVQYRVLTD